MSPKLFSIRVSLCRGIGATWYSHLVMGATLAADGVSSLLV